MIMILSAIASVLASRPRRMRLIKSGPLTNREIEKSAFAGASTFDGNSSQHISSVSQKIMAIRQV
jgi:hypothetical protein